MLTLRDVFATEVLTPADRNWSSPAQTATPPLRTVAARLAQGLPHGELLELAHSGHLSYAEQPDAFAAAVRAFTASGSHRR